VSGRLTNRTTTGDLILLQTQTEWPQLLFDNRGRHAGILFQPFGDGGLEGVQFAVALPLGRSLCRRIEILLDGSPAHAQMPFNLADWPVLGPVQAMQVVDLIGGEAWCNFSYPAEAAG
jgi:hypothetical protein